MPATQISCPVFPPKEFKLQLPEQAPQPAASLDLIGTGHQDTADKWYNQREPLMPCTGHRSEQPDSQAPEQLREQHVERHANEGPRERVFLYKVLRKPEGWLEAPGTVLPEQR